MADTPLIDMIAEREPLIPKGPVRTQVTRKEAIVDLMAWFSAGIVRRTIKEFLGATV